MSAVDFSSVWTAAGVVVGFSVTAFIFRIGREASIRTSGPPGTRLYWLPPADFVLLGSLAVVLIGVFVLPILGAGLTFARYALGWALLLLAGYPFALAGHYDILFGRVPDKTLQRREADGDYPYATEQEKGVVWLLVMASVAYLAAVAVREFAL